MATRNRFKIWFENNALSNCRGRCEGVTTTPSRHYGPIVQRNSSPVTNTWPLTTCRQVPFIWYNYFLSRTNFILLTGRINSRDYLHNGMTFLRLHFRFYDLLICFRGQRVSGATSTPPIRLNGAVLS
jgi:hypothetical protein